MKIRPEEAADQTAIHDLVTGAFEQPDEAVLVDDLRRDGELVISTIAEEDGKILGHLALSRLKSPARALALAPVSVSPTAQGRGLGSQLINDGIARAKDLRELIVFVLGDPAYYERFGFFANTALPYPCVYAGPYFMALQLSDEGSEIAPVIYPAAFEKL